MLGDPPRPASHLPRPCSKLTDKQCVLEEDSSTQERVCSDFLLALTFEP